MRLRFRLLVAISAFQFACMAQTLSGVEDFYRNLIAHPPSVQLDVPLDLAEQIQTP
jgi:hypothetical protein